MNVPEVPEGQPLVITRPPLPPLPEFTSIEEALRVALGHLAAIQHTHAHLVRPGFVDALAKPLLDERNVAYERLMALPPDDPERKKAEALVDRVMDILKEDK